MPTLTTFRGGALIVALAATLTSCDSQGPNGTTSLSVQLKDAPGDVQHAFVTITEVDLVGSGGVQVLTQTPVTTDLLTLATDVLHAGAGRRGALGHLSRAALQDHRRMRRGGRWQRREHGVRDRGLRCLALRRKRDGTLQAPSYAQSGLKVKMTDGALELTGPTKILLVDFDVTQSFGHEANGWVMHPVVTGGEITTE